MRYDMQHLKITGLCLVIMLAMSIAMAGNASATSWLVCLEGTSSENTKYENNQCTKASSGGKWESVVLPSGKSNTLRLVALTLKLTDTKATGGSSAVRCSGIHGGWGVAESGGLGKVTKFEVANPKTECERLEGGCKAGEIEEVKAVHLPWKTELTGNATKIASDGSGEPGWVVKCNTLLGKVTDECVAVGANDDEGLELTSEVTGGVLLVRGVFTEESAAKCTLGGEGAGEDQGSTAILEANGTALSFPPPIFVLRPPDDLHFNNAAERTFLIRNNLGLASYTISEVKLENSPNFKLANTCQGKVIDPIIKPTCEETVDLRARENSTGSIKITVGGEVRNYPLINP